MDPELKMEKDKMETKGLKGYEKYQLEWMIEHNYSLDDLIGNLQAVWEKLDEEKEENEVIDVTTTYEVWYDSFGFDNELFVSKNEWSNNEEKEYEDKIEEKEEEVELDI